MIQRLSILILFVLFTTSLFGQTETLLATAVEKTIDIKFDFKSKDSPNNKIIEFVAKAKAVPVHAAVLSYNVKEHQRVIKNSNKLQLQLSVGNFVFPDQVTYLKFDINRFLKPTLISYTYVFADENDNIIETKSVKDQSFKNGSFLLKKSVAFIPDANSFKLYLSSVSFGFTDDDVEKLEAFMAKVNAYYDADARLNLLEQEMNMIRNDSIEMLETYKQITIDNVKALNQIKSERFASKLDLDANDPIQFRSHFGRFEVRNRALKKELQKTLDNMHITYYKKGKDWLNWNDEEKAHVLFEKSIAEKSNYAPPYFELAQISFNHKNYTEAIDSCSYILNKLRPDTDTRYSAVKLAESVIYVYIDDIDELIVNGEYISAMEKLTLCEKYSKNIPGVKYFKEFDEIHGKLFKAYYLDLVNETKLAIEKTQFSKAQFNIDSLAKFRHQHSNYILNPEKEHLLLKDLYSGWVDAGKNYIEVNMPDSSLYAFTQAYIICNRYEVIYCTDELNELIAEARINQYNFMVSNAGVLIQHEYADSALNLLNDSEGFRQLNNIEKSIKYDSLFLAANQLKYYELIVLGESVFGNDAREALSYYDEALALENEYPIKIDSTLNHKITMAAQKYIISLCIQGETFVEALHNEKAREKLIAAQNIYDYYNMDSDDLSTTTIWSLMNKLYLGKCDKVQFSYDIQITAAKKFIGQKEFIYAQDALDKAKRISHVNDKCNLADSAYERLTTEISAMLHYQKHMIEIDELLENKDYASSIDDYKILTEFYYDSCENNFGIQHKDLYNYIFSNSNAGLIDFGVRYYTDMGKTDTALMLLNELFSREYISSWSKASQVILGTQLALNDIETDSTADPKRIVLDYTKANKWYKYLEKAYLQKWKDL